MVKERERPLLLKPGTNNTKEQDKQLEEVGSKIILPRHITRSFVVVHREYYFVYGCDTVGKAILGQAWECANELNTFGIPTMVKYCSSKSFFSDGVGFHRDSVDKAIDAIPLNGTPIIVLEKIGRGCSRMFELAPKLYAHMMMRLNKIRYKNVEINYLT